MTTNLESLCELFVESLIFQTRGERTSVPHSTSGSNTPAVRAYGNLRSKARGPAAFSGICRPTTLASTENMYSRSVFSPSHASLHACKSCSVYGKIVKYWTAIYHLIFSSNYHTTNILSFLKKIFGVVWTASISAIVCATLIGSRFWQIRQALSWGRTKKK